MDELKMPTLERKHLALKFCSLSKKDQKSILEQLPTKVRSQLIESINTLGDLDFKQDTQAKVKPLAEQLITRPKDFSRNGWGHFLNKVESTCAENDVHQSRLLQTIKEINGKE